MRELFCCGGGANYWLKLYSTVLVDIYLLERGDDRLILIRFFLSYSVLFHLTFNSPSRAGRVLKRLAGDDNEISFYSLLSTPKIRSVRGDFCRFVLF